MTSRPWQHRNSLEASRDPKVQKKVREGLHKAFEPSVVTGKRDLTEGEAAALGFNLEEGDKTKAGFHAEGDEELWGRTEGIRIGEILGLFVEAAERPLLSARELEVVAYYLWGERLPVVAVLWERNDFDGMLWELLAEHPPWTTIGSLMRPTKKTKSGPGGGLPGKSDVQRYLRNAMKKLSTTDLRRSAIQGIVRTRHRGVEEQLRDEDQAVEVWLRKTQKPRSEGVESRSVVLQVSELERYGVNPSSSETKAPRPPGRRRRAVGTSPQPHRIGRARSPQGGGRRPSQ